MTDASKKLLTTLEVAKLLHCGSDNVRRLARRGQLPIAVTVGHGQRLFIQTAVEQFAADRQARHPDEAA